VEKNTILISAAKKKIQAREAGKLPTRRKRQQKKLLNDKEEKGGGVAFVTTEKGL
jgi:hypothetical protein